MHICVCIEHIYKLNQTAWKKACIEHHQRDGDFEALTYFVGAPFLQRSPPPKCTAESRCPDRSGQDVVCNAPGPELPAGAPGLGSPCSETWVFVQEEAVPAHDSRAVVGSWLKRRCYSSGIQTHPMNSSWERSDLRCLCFVPMTFRTPSAPSALRELWASPTALQLQPAQAEERSYFKDKWSYLEPEGKN